MMAGPQVEVNCDTIDSQSEIPVRNRSQSEIKSCQRNVTQPARKCFCYLVEGDGAAGAAYVRHPAPAPAVLVIRAAADHVH
eukprot:COSAG04_NODE_32321_length_251_cov_2.039474_1_plen_80_part_01